MFCFWLSVRVDILNDHVSLQQMLGNSRSVTPSHTPDSQKAQFILIIQKIRNLQLNSWIIKLDLSLGHYSLVGHLRVHTGLCPVTYTTNIGFVPLTVPSKLEMAYYMRLRCSVSIYLPNLCQSVDSWSPCNTESPVIEEDSLIPCPVLTIVWKIFKMSPPDT